MNTSSAATLTLRHFLLNLVKPYKGLLSVMVLVGLLWAFINTFLPYTLKLIIDRVVGFAGDKSVVFDAALPFVFGYIALWVGLCAIMRLLDWAKLKLFPTLRENVLSGMFNYLNQHSYIISKIILPEV